MCPQDVEFCVVLLNHICEQGVLGLTVAFLLKYELLYRICLNRVGKLKGIIEGRMA